MIAAMKAGDQTRKTLLKVILGELNRLDSKSPSDEEVIKVLIKMRKNLEEIGDEKALAEIEILNEFLPKQMTEEEVTSIVKALISAYSPEERNIKIMGRLIKNFQMMHPGAIEGSVLSQIVKKEL